MSADKALTSNHGTADCTLLPCPGWDAEALFPSATLRVEGSWSVGAVAWGVQGSESRLKCFSPSVALAALAQKPLRPVHQGPQRPANTIAMVDRAPAAPTPRPLRSRLAGELPGAPALLIAHLLTGGVWWGCHGAARALASRSGPARELQHPLALALRTRGRACPLHAGPCFFLRPKTGDPTQLPRA